MATKANFQIGQGPSVLGPPRLVLPRPGGNSMIRAVSEPEPWPAPAPKDGETFPEPTLTQQDLDRAFWAQLILFALMAVFIVAPFILWWWLSAHKQ